MRPMLSFRPRDVPIAGAGTRSERTEGSIHVIKVQTGLGF